MPFPYFIKDPCDEGLVTGAKKTQSITFRDFGLLFDLDQGSCEILMLFKPIAIAFNQGTTSSFRPGHQSFMQRPIFRTAFAALGLLASSTFAHAASPQNTQASVATASPMQAAPDPTVHLQAPQNHSCGLFETCENTKIGLGKGDFLVRLSAIGLITNNTSSKVNIRNSPLQAINGKQGSLSVTNQAAPELTFEYFFTDHISLDLIAASTRHEARAHNTKVPNPISSGPNNNLDVGSFWVLPPTLTAAWHFRPHKRFNPYVGLGITVAFFHNTSPASNGSAAVGNAVFDKLKIKPTVGPSFNLGFDYQLVGNWFFNFDVKQILLFDAPIRLNSRGNTLTGTGRNGRVHARDSIHPTVVGAGIEYRF